MKETADTQRNALLLPANGLPCFLSVLSLVMFPSQLFVLYRQEFPLTYVEIITY